MSEFSAFVLARLLGRNDAYGAYVTDGGAVRGTTIKRSLDEETLLRHERGEIAVGIHVIGTDGLCRFVVGDWDNHEGDPTRAENNRKASLACWQSLRTRGCEPILEDSDGRGGYHVWVIFDGPVPSANAFAFARSVFHDGAESFPKQPMASGGYGNWVRLPGVHPRHGTPSRIYVGTSWSPWPECEPLFSDAKLCPRANVPESPQGEVLRDTQKRRDDSTLLPLPSTGDRLRALIELEKIDRRYASSYDDWIRIGLALHHVDPSALTLVAWDDWSRRCASKYEDGACAAKWETFRDEREDGVGMGTLVHYARQSARDASVPQNWEARRARIEDINAWLSEHAARPVIIASVERVGGRDGHYDLRMPDGRRVRIGAAEDLLDYRRFRATILRAADVVLRVDVRGADWVPIAQAIHDCREEVEAETQEDELHGWVEAALTARPALRVADAKSLEEFLSSRRAIFFLYDAGDGDRTHCAVLRLSAWLAKERLWNGPGGHRGLASRLALCGWRKHRLAIGPRGKQQRAWTYRRGIDLDGSPSSPGVSLAHGATKTPDSPPGWPKDAP